jgi:multisubunit Na+/H+ antiporter MnhC subunit
MGFTLQKNLIPLYFIAVGKKNKKSNPIYTGNAQKNQEKSKYAVEPA